MIRGDRGQSLVEILAVFPLVVLCGLAGLQALAFGASAVYADEAARAAAIARIGGREAEGAVRSALPGWAAAQVSASLSGERVTVRLRPRAILPGFSMPSIEASASAAS